MYNAAIGGCSYFVPEHRVTNDQLAKDYGKSYFDKFRKDLTPGMITRVCGIRERRYAADSMRLRDVAAQSIINLLDTTQTKFLDLDAIIIATLSPESFTPSNASLVFEELVRHYDARGFGLTAYDVNAACSGFIFALEQAVNYIALGKKKKIVVCGVEIMSRMLNGFDYHTGILFGDAAAAVIVGRNEGEFCINAVETASVTDHIDDIVYYSSLSKDYCEKLELQGSRVYRNGSALTIGFVREYLSKNDLTPESFDHFIFHQSNIRMLNEISEKLNIPERKMLTNLQDFGNTAAASIPLCLAQYNEKNKFEKGDRILLCTFGAGYTVGIADLHWNI